MIVLFLSHPYFVIYTWASQNDEKSNFDENIKTEKIPEIKLTSESYLVEIAVNTKTNKVYALGSNVSVIDGKSGILTSTIDVGYWPTHIVVNPETNKIYVTHYDTENITVIDGNRDEIDSTIPVGIFDPKDMAVNPGAEIRSM